MYPETPWLSRLIIEFGARGLVSPGEPLPECHPETPQGRLICDYLFLLGELFELKPRFSFKGSHCPESDGLENVLGECHQQAAFLIERMDVASQALPEKQLSALAKLEAALAPPPEFGEDETAADRWRRGLVFHAFAVFTPMFRWPDGPWRERLAAEFDSLDYSPAEFAAIERFIAPFEGRDYTPPPDLSPGPRQRLSELAERRL